MVDFDILQVAGDYVFRTLPTIYEIWAKFRDSLENSVDLNENEETIESDFREYITRSATRYGTAKPFFYRDEPKNIYSFYIPVSLKYANISVRNVTVSEIDNITRRTIITAQAGAGKSMLLRHLFIDTIENTQKIPIFIELRNLNDESSSDFLVERAIRKNMREFGFKIPESIEMDSIMNAGPFVILLDGFDEVKNELRRVISDQIESLSRRLPNCSIIISSRQDEHLSKWDDFVEFGIEPLTIDEACELVYKLPYADVDLKEKFIEDLRDTMYTDHESFLSNPLLLSIMLLTYSQNAEIPRKIHLFYDRAYIALFQQHDALKGGFQRHRKTDLDIQDFSEIFSVYCLQTYHDRTFQFTRSEAISYLQKVKVETSMDFDESQFIDDCLQSVCLFIEDGLQLVFSHRSFQEYFVALYINNTAPKIQKRLLNNYISFVNIDSVYRIIYGMNKQLLERELLLERLTRLFSKLAVKRKVTLKNFADFIKGSFDSVVLKDIGVMGQISYVRQLTDVERDDGFYDSEADELYDIFYFLYRYVIDRKNSIEDHKIQDRWIDSELNRTKEKEFRLTTMTSRSRFMINLAKFSTAPLSIRGMNDVWEYYNTIYHRNRNLEQSLEQLLSNE